MQGDTELDMDSGYDVDIVSMVTINTLLSPLKNVLSSRATPPLFEIKQAFCKLTPQTAFLTEDITSGPH